MIFGDFTSTAIIVVAIAIGAAALTIYTALTRKSHGRYLCDDCKFNNAQDCLLPQRPRAMACTSFRRIESPSIGTGDDGITNQTGDENKGIITQSTENQE